MPELADIFEAREPAGAHALRTPCTRSLVFKDLLPGRLHFKFESLEHTGSFKVRGACNKLAQLSDEEILAAQGTLGLEILDQVPDVTTVLVPIGGGGVISARRSPSRDRKPDVRVIGAEAEAAPSGYEFRRAGERVPVDSSDIIADGIAVKQAGRLTFPIIQGYVDEIVLVDEEEDR